MVAPNERHEPSSAELIELYRTMMLIRKTEERLRDNFHAGELPGAVHLYIGQEAIAAGVCHHLSDEDWITSTHRGHGHFLAKGGDPKAMVAEIYAKETGICKGMGGSMHVADFSKGIIGANGIVGGGLGIAVGAALAAKLDKKGRVAVCFFGDGAANQGVFMEALNVSTLWKLPLLLVCEHNGFSEFSPSSTVTAGEIVDRAKAFKIPSDVVDGNDVVAVWQATAPAVRRARDGEGPSFIQAMSYRTHGHSEGEKLWLKEEYRSRAEIDDWQRRDPIDRMSEKLLALGIYTESDCNDLHFEVAALVDEAFVYAKESPPAAPEQLHRLMFADQQP